MSDPRPRATGALAPLILIAATITLFVSITHDWRGRSIVAAAVVITVVWETSTRQRQLGAWRPRHPVRPWKRDTE